MELLNVENISLGSSRQKGYSFYFTPVGSGLFVGSLNTYDSFSHLGFPYPAYVVFTCYSVYVRNSRSRRSKGCRNLDVTAEVKYLRGAFWRSRSLR